MTLQSPNLDDRDFRQLLEEAVAVVRRSGGAWNNLSLGDPGLVLLEAFAYLTDLMLYRLNRVPEKAYVEFLRILGVRRQPPTAAAVELEFSRSSPDGPAAVPAGTEVSSSQRSAAERVTFVTAADLELAGGQERGRVRAHHCEEVHGELLGVSTGEPGQSFRLARPPVVRPTGHELDLVVAVEANEADLAGRPRAREFQGRPYVVWREVHAFGRADPADRAYTVDRVAGTITFAPAVRRRAGTDGRDGGEGAAGGPGDVAPPPDDEMPAAGEPPAPGEGEGEGDGGDVSADASPVAAVPRAGAQVRAWYRRGGGSGGNVAPRTLTEVDLDGFEVTNAERAIGGRDAESLENAIQRGSQELHEPRRAVTADDVEALAARVGGVARVRASTAADVWAHALPGTVELVLVPSAPGGAGGRLDLATLESLQSPDVLAEVAAELDRRQPLGVRFHPRWAELKPVSVSVQVVVDGTEDPAAVERRVASRLYEAISPVPRPDGTSWPFGRSLRASDVFDLVLREPGVRYVDAVRFKLDEVPDGDVTALAADRFQARTWYAGQGSTLFRSQNDGGGWEPVTRFGGAAITRIVTHPQRPGMVAVATSAEEEGAGSSRLWVSADCGSTWPGTQELGFAWDSPEARHHIRDVAWIGDEPALALATDRGLYSHALGDPAPLQRAVADAGADAGAYAVATAPTRDGGHQVVVALQGRGGVYRSLGGVAGPYEPYGLEGEDVRRLHSEQRGLRHFLWAATFAVGDDPGRGCFRVELREESGARADWRHLGAGWDGGICHDLAVRGNTAIAGSRFNGVLTLDLSADEPRWRQPSVERSNLPLVESRRFEPVLAVDAAQGSDVALVAGGFGVYRSTDLQTYQTSASRLLEDEVTLPPAGLVCSGSHRVEVRAEDEAR